MLILLIDGHADTRAVLSRSLVDLGHNVLTARSAKQALSSTAMFDVMVCDLDLPDGSAFDLLRRVLRRRPVRAVALGSADAAQREHKAGAVAGFQRYLSKPVVIDELRRAIRAVGTRGRREQSKRG